MVRCSWMRMSLTPYDISSSNCANPVALEFPLASTILEPEDNTQGQPLFERYAVTRRRPQAPVRPGFSYCSFVEDRPAAGLSDLDIQYSSIRADEHRKRHFAGLVQSTGGHGVLRLSQGVTGVERGTGDEWLG